MVVCKQNCSSENINYQNGNYLNFSISCNELIYYLLLLLALERNATESTRVTGVALLSALLCSRLQNESHEIQKLQIHFHSCD